MTISQSRDRARSAHIWARRLLTLVASAWLIPAAAQTAPPARDGNRWDGVAHQPTRDAVAAEEQHAGVAPSSAERHQQDTELQRLGNRELRDAGAPPQ